MPLLLASFCTALLSACDPNVSSDAQYQQQGVTDVSYVKADGILQTLHCPLPKQERAFKPLRKLASHDSPMQQLAREYVELKRRETHTSWQSAAQYFNQDQYATANWKTRMQGYRDQLSSNLDNYRRNNYTSDIPLVERAETLRDQYLYACKHYREANHQLVALDDDLAKLRQETQQPWRSENRPLTCSMQQAPGCYPD